MYSLASLTLGTSIHSAKIDTATNYKPISDIDTTNNFLYIYANIHTNILAVYKINFASAPTTVTAVVKEFALTGCCTTYVGTND